MEPCRRQRQRGESTVFILRMQGKGRKRLHWLQRTATSQNGTLVFLLTI
jgi:hypothetical protein